MKWMVITAMILMAAPARAQYFGNVQTPDISSSFAEGQRQAAAIQLQRQQIELQRMEIERRQAEIERSQAPQVYYCRTPDGRFLPCR